MFVVIIVFIGIVVMYMNGMIIYIWVGIGIKDVLGEDEFKCMKECKYLKEYLENV